MQQLTGCFDPIPYQKKIFVSKIKNLRDLLQQDPQVAELLSALGALGARAREVVEPKVLSFGDLLESLRNEAVTVARDTTKDIKTEVDGAINELADFFRAQGMEVEVVKVQPRAGEKIETEEDFLAAVERLLGEAEAAHFTSEPTDEELADTLLAQLAAFDSKDSHDDLTPDEMWELIGLQDDLLLDQNNRIEQLEAKLEAQAKLAAGANARCTGLHEGVLSALSLIDNLDILRAKEHLAFVLRQAGVSDCNIHNCTL